MVRRVESYDLLNGKHVFSCQGQDDVPDFAQLFDTVL